MGAGCRLQQHVHLLEKLEQEEWESSSEGR